jgi:hypothetical protein
MSIALPSKSVLPTHLDLPYKDDKPVENDDQPEQSALLTSSLIPHPGNAPGPKNSAPTRWRPSCADSASTPMRSSLM